MLEPIWIGSTCKQVHAGHHQPIFKTFFFPIGRFLNRDSLIVTSKFEITTDKIAYLKTKANNLPFLTFHQNHLSVVTWNKWESLKAYDSIKEDYRQGKETANSRIQLRAFRIVEVRELEPINEKHTEIWTCVYSDNLTCSEL